VLIDGADVTAAEPGSRDVAMVFQSYALYPHMSVAQNIGFPLKMIGLPSSRIDHAVQEAAQKVAIGHLLDRKPGQLSGGQQQRCALARAIVREPRLFLLDEPLSNLDAKLRLETRAELRKLQRSLGVTAVYVTHDQEEAMTIADRMAVFMEGRIVQVGTPHEIFRKPATAAVASFIGTPPMNLLPATFEGGQVCVGEAWMPVTAPAGTQPGKITLGVRPGDLRLGATGIPARVDFVEDFGDSSIVNLEAAGQRVKLRAGELPAVREGEGVHLSFDAAAAHLFDWATGNRI
jgi:ABC-type sugar transport system ATPase subunit